MRILQSLAISVSAWVFLFFLVYESELCLDEWEDIFVFVVIGLMTVTASLLAFLQCDIRVSLKGSNKEAVSEKNPRANIAYLLTGLALGLFPALLWAINLMSERDAYADEVRGLEVVVARSAINPGDTITNANFTMRRMLRSNVSDSHYYYHELELLLDSKAKVKIPQGTPILFEFVEGAVKPERDHLQTGAEPIRMQDLVAP